MGFKEKTQIKKSVIAQLKRPDAMHLIFRTKTQIVDTIMVLECFKSAAESLNTRKANALFTLIFRESEQPWN